jgi:hypothetical protein
MNAIETTKPASEFRNVALGELTESTSNPCKTIDETGLEELAQSSATAICRGMAFLLPGTGRRRCAWRHP